MVKTSTKKLLKLAGNLALISIGCGAFTFLNENFNPNPESVNTLLTTIRTSFFMGQAFLAPQVHDLMLETMKPAKFPQTFGTKHSSKKQIERIAEALDCDLSYAKVAEKGIRRMKHNDGEPIYVRIDSKLSKDDHNAITKSLLNLFEFIYGINPSYHVAIVNDMMFETASKAGKTCINYVKDFSFDRDGVFTESMYDMNRSGLPTRRQNLINFGEVDFVNWNKKDPKTTYTEMLRHLLVLLGCYSLKEGEENYFHGNTVVENDGCFGEIFPNDLKVLMCLYPPQIKDEKILSQYIEDAKQAVKDYEKVFYFEVARQKFSGAQHLPKAFTFKGQKTHFDDCHEKITQKYDLTILSDSYCLEIKDKNNNVIDEAYGKIQRAGDVVFLKDVHLNCGPNPLGNGDIYEDGYKCTFAVFKKDGKISLTSTDGKFFCNGTVISKDAEAMIREMKQ